MVGGRLALRAKFWDVITDRCREYQSRAQERMRAVDAERCPSGVRSQVCGIACKKLDKDGPQTSVAYQDSDLEPGITLKQENYCEI
ncbi:hypothetical protein BGZ65_009192 [Modicella reniformis]|uniref:Uncharacterized protein n=1 Tax=Modicella reniformis TaxID=1440133 RepID=A0A9P6III3_9FUNG|nr:hypothetical protein BGZ65_009192 [Modicella reniformis]